MYGQFSGSRDATSGAASTSSRNPTPVSHPVKAQNFRWKVTEAPDPTPLGRTSANRPRRGRPRKHPPKDKDAQQKKDEELSIINWQAPLRVYQQPPPGAHILPWAQQWPEILQFYMTHSAYLDVTGNNLYSPTRYKPTTGAFLNSFHTSPGTLTLRILFAEASRPDRRASLERMLWLKGQALALVNEGLRDPNRQLSAGTLSDIVTLHNYEQVWGERHVARMHRKGLSHLLNAMGGIENIKGPAALLVPMILWTDRARQARRLWDPTEEPPEFSMDIERGLQPLHPLNIALLPPDQLGTSSGRGHAIGVSILGPGVRLMVALDALRQLSAGAAACRMYDNAAMADTLRGKLKQAEGGLLAMRRDPQDKGEAAYFTSPKYVLQQLMFEAGRLGGLVVARSISAYLLDRTGSAWRDLDESVLAISKLDVRPLLDFYPRILLWILFIHGPLQQGGQRASFTQLASVTCSKIGLDSWDAVKSVLATVYYYPELQEVAGKTFWAETVQEPSSAPTQEPTPPPDDIPRPNETWNKFAREST